MCLPIFEVSFDALSLSYVNYFLSDNWKHANAPSIVRVEVDALFRDLINHPPGNIADLLEAEFPSTIVVF